MILGPDIWQGCCRKHFQWICLRFSFLCSFFFSLSLLENIFVWISFFFFINAVVGKLSLTLYQQRSVWFLEFVSSFCVFGVNRQQVFQRPSEVMNKGWKCIYFCTQNPRDREAQRRWRWKARRGKKNLKLHKRLRVSQKLTQTLE